ncbi:hypothetical protein CASFOL_029278 [Castilleja foliolosa]|uniref:Uncharacterized protein n=1 Tax=Castilleja foliolosa TaxID=1961234 RepID=A0ABD3CAP5_9LAMI
MVRKRREPDSGGIITETVAAKSFERTSLQSSMVRKRREPDSGGIITETAEYNTVFVDTSLDTHLAILKIVLEHLQCFPEIMDISIQSLKCLSWCRRELVSFSRCFKHFTCHSNANSSKNGLTKSITMDVRNVDNSCGGLLSDTKRIQPTIAISQAEMIPGFTVKNSLEKTADIQNSNFYMEKCTETESLSKKKRKTRRTEEDVCRNPSSKDTDALFHASVTDAVMSGVVYCGKSMVDAVKEGLNLCEQQGILTEVSGLKNDQSVLDNRVVIKGLSVPAVGEMSNLGFPVEDQKNGTRENSITFVNSESDGIHEASSEVPSRQSEEKLEEKHEIVVNTDDPARTTKDEGVTINFKEFFVPCE